MRKKLFYTLLITLVSALNIQCHTKYFGALPSWKSFGDFAACPSWLCSGKRTPAAVPKPSIDHVHMMHLDGFRGDVFKALLVNEKLPNFAYLVSRGKISYTASTVDKSETMKVIESYLTSRRDTYIAGWWQFSKEHFQFKNFWLDPTEVVNYALGLEFPLYPTVFDFLSAQGENVTAGFSLHRRSVPFNNYSRNYVMGAKSVFKHTYYDQAHSTMKGVIEMYQRIASGLESSQDSGVTSSNKKMPAFSTSLLAAADEFSHLEGLIMPDWERSQGNSKDRSEYCFLRKPKNERTERAFKLFEEIQDQKKYVTKVKKSKLGKLQEFCIWLPKVSFFSDPDPEQPIGKATVGFAAPRYVLAMLLIDIEVGKLIQTLKEIPFKSSTLFDHTLFAILGDHGMVDTKHMMAPINPKHPDPYRHPQSMSQSFVEYLNQKLEFKTPSKTKILAGELIGVDNYRLPLELAFPHLDPRWQDPKIQAITQDAQKWANGFVDDFNKVLVIPGMKETMLEELLAGFLPADKFQESKTLLLTVLAQVYLKGNPSYVAAEQVFLRKVYNQSVRLIYGGGARNNAEIFLPVLEGGQTNWDRRPSFNEILTYSGKNGKPLMEALKENPGVGLIFIRKNNSAIDLNQKMEIAVSDRFGNEGLIQIKRDEKTKELIYGYTVLQSSKKDPLGYVPAATDSAPAWTFGTYNEWNDRSIKDEHYYHNAVAGMGSYLYSNNPAIGDITLMHAQGWNFGENAGGHGGLHREEKLTMMLFSGPEMKSGSLLGKAKYRVKTSETQDLAYLVEDPHFTFPTVVDMAPTVLTALGYGENALSTFAKKGFKKHLQKWNASQREDCYQNLWMRLNAIQQKAQKAGLSVDFSPFEARLKRLLQFIPTDIPKLPNYDKFQEDGNQLILYE